MMVNIHVVVFYLSNISFTHKCNSTYRTRHNWKQINVLELTSCLLTSFNSTCTVTECYSSGLALLLHIWEVPHSILEWRPIILMQIFCGIPSLLHKNAIFPLTSCPIHTSITTQLSHTMVLSPDSILRKS
jgi:hypothetical protein